jgi:hypothetical protein
MAIFNSYVSLPEGMVINRDGMVDFIWLKTTWLGVSLSFSKWWCSWLYHLITIGIIFMGLPQHWELTSKVLGIDLQMLGMYPNVRHLPMRSNQTIRMRNIHQQMWGFNIHWDRRPLNIWWFHWVCFIGRSRVETWCLATKLLGFSTDVSFNHVWELIWNHHIIRITMGYSSIVKFIFAQDFKSSYNQTVRCGKAVGNQSCGHIFYIERCHSNQ